MAALPASNSIGHSVIAAAKHFGVDQVTIRRWLRDGCPHLRYGRRGPGNGALLDLQEVGRWLGRANTPVEQTREDIMSLLAAALLKALNEDHADIRAGVSRADATAVLLVAWEQISKTMGKSYAFDQQPAAIRTLMSEL